MLQYDHISTIMWELVKDFCDRELWFHECMVTMVAMHVYMNNYKT